MNGPAHEAGLPTHELFSPEGVRLDLPIAGPAPRMIAYAIDFLIIALLIVLLLLALFSSLPIADVLHKWFGPLFGRAAKSLHPSHPGDALPVQVEGLILAVFLLTQFAVESGYFIFWEMLTGGRSPGKALVGLRVVQRNGLPIALTAAMVRNVFRIVDLLPASYTVGLISILVSSSGQRLGDHAAGTIVIRLDRPPAAPELQTSLNPHALALTREQVARIGPPEMRLLRGTLRRLAAIPEDRREPLLAEVAESLCQRLELAELPRSDRAQFLRDLLAVAERYSRDEAG